MDRAIVDHFFSFYFLDDFGAGDDDFLYFCHVAQLQGVESYCYRVGLCLRYYCHYSDVAGFGGIVVLRVKKDRFFRTENLTNS